MTGYSLQKNIWTELDFEQMNWHDNPIHAFASGDNFQLKFDIDYIFEWVLKGKTYNFWISPCTLVFENVYDLVFDVGPSSPAFTIDAITKSNPQKPKNADYINRDIEYDWTIEMQEGVIQFKSVGFKQYVRQFPLLLPTQKIDEMQRNGISFNTLQA